jgi:hypothetical protein
MSTIVFDAHKGACRAGVFVPDSRANAWPLARLKRVAWRFVQIATISLVLASIPSDSGPIHNRSTVTVHGLGPLAVLLHVAEDADR